MMNLSTYFIKRFKSALEKSSGIFAKFSRSFGMAQTSDFEMQQPHFLVIKLFNPFYDATIILFSRLGLHRNVDIIAIDFWSCSP
jgi:hypothetical protein